MAYRERLAWASLVTTMLVWGWYFLQLWRHADSRDVGSGWPVALFVECVILSVVIQIVLGALATLRTRKVEREQPDEREQRIEARATSAAYTVLIVLVVTLALACPFIIGVDLGDGLRRVRLPPGLDATLLMANGLLAAVINAEILRSLVVIGMHRLGRA